jgi:hypothetical protein
MSALQAGFQFLTTTLGGDATLLATLIGGVHQTVAPIGTPSPFGIYAAQSLMDKNSATAQRIYSPDLFLVKAVGPATVDAALYTAVDRIFVLLNRVNATVAAGIILACYREQEVYYTELINGYLWEHIGGLYRIQIK